MTRALSHLADAPIELATLRQLGRHALEDIVGDDELRSLFVERMREGLREGASVTARRAAMRYFWRTAALCGIDRQTVMAQQIWIQLGAQSEHDARRSIELVKEAEAKPLEVQVADAAAWLAERLLERPDLKAAALARIMPLFDEVPRPETNGHA
jgi:hypothetical protein